MALGSRDHGQGRGNGQGGLLDSTRRAERIRRRGDSGYYAAREAERTRRRRGSAYQPARGRDGRGFVNGVPGHQAPRAPAAHHGPQWWTQPQAGLGEMSRKLLFSLFSFLILQCIIGSP